MERGRYKGEPNREPLTIEEIRKMEYAGGGYFREKLPKGQSARILHGPELLRVLGEEIDRLNEQYRTRNCDHTCLTEGCDCYE